MKSVFITLGKEYELRLSFEAIEDFENKTGKGIHDDLSCGSATTNLQKLWAMMRQTNKDLTLEDVKKLVNEHSHILKIKKPVFEATLAAFETESPNAKAPAEKKS